ncbi:MAG TPA: hypothetical protein VIK10_07210 [Prolixibacteraceae bacterium]
MKKLALVLTFVFGVAMIAPAFAKDPAKKEVKKECTMTCAKDGKAACCAAAGKNGNAPCPKAEAAAKAAAKTIKK